MWKTHFAPLQDATDLEELRDELREIARQMRALAAVPAPARPVDILGDQVRAQMARIQERKAA